MPHRILITGAQGMLGSDLLPECERVFGADNVIGFGRGELDITSFQSVSRMFADVKPTIVVNSAAYTNVDGAEVDRDAAHEINCVGPENLAKVAAALGARLIHFSTDQVFDGERKRPWLETDEPNPLNQYATTKLAGERAVLAAGPHVILRVQWLYGEKKERFSQLRSKELFTPFADQVGAPTWTRDIARVVPKLIQSEGLFHFAYDDAASWADVFAFVKEEWKLKVRLEPKQTKDVPLPARRPLYCVMSNQKLKRELNLDQLGSWKDSLREFLALIKN
ncbi:MAG: dTDP-4-dehydrorhamnose reductase [Deltaproteobacteria bacterium]|nr:dTDP-4-dehydrorhamnose reductase [Deltaproteobacteria bacterium]MBI3294802.1 dTDP-4-dehydrorhamnose reductase [Deltaproteobacteria bacterium]